MEYNTTFVTKESNEIEGFEKISADFSEFHQDPLNVFLHFITTPIGMIGVFSILHSTTKSSSAAMSLASLYLLSLLPVVPNGVFAGTAILLAMIVYAAKKFKLGLYAALAFIVWGYVMQDIAHVITGEKTFQSTYSDGGHIDMSNPIQWVKMLAEHTYYLLPLCVHVALPFLKVPEEVKNILDAPLPDPMQQLSAFAWLLGPLICCALGSYCLDTKNCFCFFPGSPYFYRILQCSLLDEKKRIPLVADHKDMVIKSSTAKIANEVGVNFASESHESRENDLKALRDWVMAQNPAEDKSSHYWFKDLPDTVKDSFSRCLYSTQIYDTFRSLFSERHYCFEGIDGMNEIYVTGPAREDDVPNSDHVFYSRHVDGPYGLVPFVSVYRCIVGMDKNKMISTNFPLANIKHNACNGDVLAFDFNREVHYISRDDSKKEESDQFRVTLKLHYCIYPRVLAPLGWAMKYLNASYNKSFRALFLKTIQPTTMYEHFLAWNVNVNTFLFDRIESWIGQRNLLYLIFVAALWRATGMYEVFFGLTSYVHYFRYISTFYVRRDIDFGSFKRDVFLFKCIALVQLFYHYFCPSTTSFVFDPISILMALAGYTVSSLATKAIGIDRTYFAAELGLVEMKWINQFPYGYIPHPMIVSQVFALLGLYKAAHFRQEWPFVVPIHVLLYFIHMLQEHFDIYRRYPEDANKIGIMEAKKLQ